MQEKKNKGLLISLIALITLTSIVFFFQGEEDRIIVDLSLFKVEDLAKIDGIQLESARGKVKLRYESTGWKVNDRFSADRQMITVLFATLEQALPKRPVAASKLDWVNAMLDSSGVSVSLFEGAVLRKQFTAGGDKKSEAYFRLGGKSETYLMAIPGYRVYVSQIFELEENGWRDKRIFNFNWRNFTTLSTSFPSDPASDFVITRPDKSLTVALAGIAEPDTARVNAFLDDVLQLTADQIVAPGSSKKYDSLANTVPVNRMEIRDIANRTYRLSLFPPMSGDPMVLGTAFENERVLLDRKKVARVVRKRAYFKLQNH